MGNGDVTGKILTRPLQKAADVSAGKPVVTWATIVTILLSGVGGIWWGVAKLEAAEAKADSAATVAAAVQKSVEAVQKNTDLILQVMLNQGKVVIDTVKVPVVVNGADTIAVEDTTGHAPR